MIRSVRRNKTPFSVATAQGSVDVQLPTHGWCPRWYQAPLLDYFDSGGKHAAVVWPRRHGKDMTVMNLYAQKMFERVGLYWLMYPMLKQGRKIAWSGMDKMGRKLLSAIPESAIVSVQNDEMRVELCNGSVFQVVGADNIDSLVGANPVAITYSEFSLMDPKVPDYMDPILEENDGFELMIYTPRGNNHGRKLLDHAKSDKDWFWDHKTAVDLRVLSPEKLRKAQEKCIMKYGDDSLFQQEYMCSFETSLSGSYYGHFMDRIKNEGRIRKIPVNPRFPVYTAWDLGVGDAATIWFLQCYDREIYAVNYYECSGAGMLPMINYLKQYQDKYGIKYAKHFAPWDIVVREFTTGRTRIEVAREHGVRFVIVPKHYVDDGIEAVRGILPNFYFDAVNCARGIDCLCSYNKEYDDDKQVYCDKPLHNWASNGADSLRVFAMGIRDKELFTKEGVERTPEIGDQQVIQIASAWDPRDY